MLTFLWEYMNITPIFQHLIGYAHGDDIKYTNTWTNSGDQNCLKIIFKLIVKLCLLDNNNIL